MKRPRALTLTAGVMTAALAVAGCGGGTTKAKSAATTIPPTVTTTSTTSFPSLEVPTSSATTSPATTAHKSTTSTTKPKLVATTTTTVPTSLSQKAALARLVSAYPTKSYVISTILHTGNLSYLALARDVASTSSLIDIYSFSGSAFVAVARNIGAGQNLDPVDPSTIAAADITGAAFPDFLVPLAAGDHDNGVLVSFVGGFWHLIGPSDRIGAAASPELVQPTIVGNEIRQSVNNCVPSCAQGTYSVTMYGYDPPSGKLVPIGPTLQSSTP